MIGYLAPTFLVSAEDIRDVKPPIDLPENYLLLIAGLTILFLGIVGLLVRHFMKRIKPNPVSLLPPWMVAQKALEEIKSEDLPQQGKIKEFYTRLSGIIRHYLEDQLDIRAPEMTTEEFFSYIKQKDALTDEQKTALKNFLDCCDMVKFAKYNSNIQETQQSLTLAQRLIDETRAKAQAAAAVPKP